MGKERNPWNSWYKEINGFQGQVSGYERQIINQFCISTQGFGVMIVRKGDQISELNTGVTMSTFKSLFKYKW